MVFGQMGDNSTSRSKSVYSGLTLAEYLRDEKKQDVLLFIDNMYRFVQAKSEISNELNANKNSDFEEHIIETYKILSGYYTKTKISSLSTQTGR